MLPISVIIPVYNAEKYIEETLKSVLCQSFPAVEVLVINDGSTDDTLTVLEKNVPDIRLLNKKNQGPAATLNKGVLSSTQPYLAFLDADDIWSPTKLEIQWKHFQQIPELEISFGWIKQFISQELPEEIKAGIFCPDQPQRGFHKGTMLARRTIFDKVGLFDERIQWGDFIEWFTRVEEAGVRYEFVDEVLMTRRLHRNGLTNKRENEKDYARLLKMTLDRRRQKQ